MGIRQDAFDFMERAKAHGTAEDLLADLSRNVARLGFDHMVLTGLPMDPNEVPTVHMNGWPAEWFERYIAQDHHRHDGVKLHAMQTTRPFFWDEIPPEIAQRQETQNVHNEAGTFDLRNGYCVPMFSTAYWQSAVAFATGDEKIRLSKTERGALDIMAMAANTAMVAMKHEESGEPILITDREREIVAWLFAGKTAWETSMILGISEQAVRKHLANIRTKFKTSNTVQAIVEGLRSGHFWL
jgi:LuxR family quorum sensing-dependent transcriptional regulator